jgi:hypothetical protein
MLNAACAPVPDLKNAGRPVQIRRGQAIDNSFSIVWHLGSSFSPVGNSVSPRS